MPRIRLTRNTVLEDGPKDVGWEGDVSDRDANMLIAIGKAVAVEPKAARTKDVDAELEAEKAEAYEAVIATAVPGGKRPRRRK